MSRKTISPFPSAFFNVKCIFLCKLLTFLSNSLPVDFVVNTISSTFCAKNLPSNLIFCLWQFVAVATEPNNFPHFFILHCLFSVTSFETNFCIVHIQLLYFSNLSFLNNRRIPHWDPSASLAGLQLSFFSFFWNNFFQLFANLTVNDAPIARPSTS